MSLALARKYRPHTFNDLIGQETVSKTLSLALEGKRLSHAYLFSGLRGSGKTSTARIFAKALLCEKGETSNPCGTCAHCSMAIENRHIDIIEMDAASNRGIDDIKDLIEHTKYKPSMARYKIFIIDEVHMLTNQAFNALLKTLEEPPDFVKFILATTDPLKLPTTILSRTQHFRFKKIPQNLVLAHLEHILTLENIQYESHALNILARSGAGSLRDSLTLLDQAIVYSKNFVNVDTVTGMLGIIEPTLLEQLLRDIYQHDRTALLAFITQAANYEAEMVLDELTLLLKSLLLSETKFEGSQHFSILNIERFFRIIAETKHLLFLGSDGEFILSLTLFKMMESLQIKEIDQMITNLEKELQGNTTIPLTPVSPQTPITSDKEPYKKPPISTLPETLPTAPSIKITKESFSAHLDTFKSLIVKLYDRNYELGKTFESNISFISFEEQTLKWGSTAQEEHKKRLITHWGLINMFVKECFGVETKIVNIPQVAVTPQSIETPKEEEMKSSCIAPEAGETEAAKEKDPSTLLEETMVKEAIALFDPKKVRIKRNT